LSEATVSLKQRTVLIGAQIKRAVISDAGDHSVFRTPRTKRATILSWLRDSLDEWRAYIAGIRLRSHGCVCLANPQGNGQMAVFHDGQSE
jgi:hypothetical protein